MNTLVVIPTYLREPDDFNVVVKTLESVHATEPDAPIVVVDDCSPAQGLVDELTTAMVERGVEADVYRKEENTGFSRTVNVGLRRALENGQNAVLLNADIECLYPGWVAKMEAQADTTGRPAAVVGALLIYPLGLIQHAGIFFSLLTRSFDHRYRFGPARLPEAQVPCVCPVTGAFQFIRHSTLDAVGLYDEEFRMGYEDVDYCLRVFDAGLECIYQPAVKATHHESLFRGRADAKLNEWQNESLLRLMDKHRTTNMARWIPELV